MTPINVLWVIDHVCYDGSLHGGGRLYWNLLPQFDPAHCRIIPYLLRASDPIRTLFAQSPTPVSILDKPKFDPTTLWSFLELIRTEQIQVMHLHCYAASTFGRLAGLMTGVPTLIHDYDTEVYFPYPGYLSLADRLLAPTTAGAIAASPMVRQFLIHKRKIDPAKIRTLFHAIPAAKFVPVSPERRHQVRQQLRLQATDQLVGTVTKLGPQRGNEYFLQAAAQILQQHPHVVFVLVYKLTRFHRLPNKKYVEVSTADTEQAIAHLQNLAQELGIADRLRLVEWPEDVDAVVAALDIFVAPFLSGRFSSVALLEAMAQGKPVIATRLGESEEILQNTQGGYLVTPGDVPELTRVLLELLRSPRQRMAMSAAVRAIAQTYSVDACIQKLQSWYQDLASAAPQ